MDYYIHEISHISDISYETVSTGLREDVPRVPSKIMHIRASAYL
jgi:hypothetical protein